MRASPVDERLIVRDRVPRARRRAADRARCSTARAPTAIFAANNLLAEHAWHVLRRRAARAAATTSRSSASTTCRGWPWSSPGSPWSRSRRSRWADGPRALLLRRVDEPDGAAASRCSSRRSSSAARRRAADAVTRLA